MQQFIPLEVKTLCKATSSIVEKIRTIPLLTYKEVIEYFINERPDYPIPSSGVLIRENSPKGIKIFQVFIDFNEKLICHPDGTPYGRILLAREINRELKEVFGEEDVIFVR